MAYFGSPNYSPMDQKYHREIKDANARSDAEKPLFELHQIGQTVIDVDPSGRSRNIIESVDAAFKGGAGNIQMVMSAQGPAGMGGGARAYGEEAREAIRELQKATNARLTGIELPNNITNLTGFDPRQGFNEEQRKHNLDEVRDAIKFVGDIAGGGGVDIISFEFPRNFSDSNWWNKGKDEKGKSLFQQKDDRIAMMVNEQTGQLVQIDKKQDYYLYRDPKTFKPLSEEQLKEGPRPWKWEDFQRWAETKGKRPEEMLQEEQLEVNKQRLEGDRAYYEDLVHGGEDGLRQFKNKKINDLSSDEQRAYKHYENLVNRGNHALQSLRIQEKKLEEEEKHTKPIDDYGMKKATESYSQAGLWAWQESQKNQYTRDGKGSIYVGPEMGHPQYFGSHPKEWVDLILKSREELQRKLVQDEDMSEREASQIAKEHIKGELDTSHLGMWLQNFKPELSWDKRVSEFKDWFKDQMEYLAEQNKKYDLIGGIQAVDSASGAHGHLPIGQGVLGKDIVEYMRILKEKGGYKGDITSEGHEEERLGQGRILTKAWETLGSPIGSGYFHGQAMPQFRDIRNSYAQIGYGTTGIFTSYVPSNDFQLWSQVPLE